MKLSLHQKRILAAILELERRGGLPWWSRWEIGQAVGAGGYHAAIQKRTMLALSALGLVYLEVESWPAAVRRLVRCSCAAYGWGLTDAGRQVAEALNVHWPPETEKRFRYVGLARADREECEGRTTRGDRFVYPGPLDLDEDEDGESWKGNP